MNKRVPVIAVVLMLALNLQVINGQEGGYVFDEKIDIPVSSVKDQYRSGTRF